MPIQPRTLLTLLPALALGACFDPMVDPIDADGPSSGPDGSTTDPGATTIDTADTGIVDSTGDVDAPPEIQAFTVNGSTAPAEQQVGGMIVFDVDATDDVGIERVEIYDGGEMIATVDSSPYVVEVLVSSVDNGSHAYTAVVVDTVGQTDESGVVPLSVNVVGGAVLELREDIGDTSSALFIGFPRLAFADNGDVLVTRSTTANAMGLRDLRASRYSPSLSLLWEDSLNPPGTSVLSGAHPIITSGGELLVGGIQGEQDADMTLFRADAATSSPLSPLTLSPTGQDIVFPVASQLANETVVLSTAPNVLEGRDPALMSTLWTAPQFDDAPDDSQVVRGIVGIDIDNADNILLTFVPSDSTCGADNDPCIRKISPEGTTLWTRPAAGGDNLAVPLRARFDQDGRVVTAWVQGSDSSVQVYDPEGNLLEDFSAFEDDFFFALDLAIDPQGNLLVAGLVADDPFAPWAARLSTQGDVLWSRTYEPEIPASGNGSVVSGIAVTNEGRVYLAGASQMASVEILGYEGVAWIAEIGL